MVLLKGALDAALEADAGAERAESVGVAARRKESYYAAVAARSTYAARLRPLAHERYTS